MRGHVICEAVVNGASERPLWPNNCIHCGAGLGAHEDFDCPGRELTAKDYARFRKTEKSRVKESLSDLDDLMKGL